MSNEKGDVYQENLLNYTKFSKESLGTQSS